MLSGIYSLKAIHRRFFVSLSSKTFSVDQMCLPGQEKALQDSVSSFGPSHSFPL